MAVCLKITCTQRKVKLQTHSHAPYLFYKQRLLWDYSQAPGLRKKEIGADLHTSKNKQKLALVIMINGGWALIAAVKRKVLSVLCGISTCNTISNNNET